MFEEVVEKILKSLEGNLIAASYPKFSGVGYRAHKIDAKNFHQIRKSHADKKIAFVDGGNAEIIGSAGFSLNLIRVCYAVYQGSKKISANKFEILAFVQAVNQDNEIFYKTTFFETKNPIGLEEISFSSFDHTLMLGVNRAEISSVANALRRFAELRLAKLVADRKIADVIVLDGNLQSTLTNENSYLNQLYESCIESNVILSALSKTTSLFTDNGNLLSVVLGSISKLPLWLYHPIVEISNTNHRAEIFFAKFHHKSRHIFRFEILNMQKMLAEDTVNILANHCVDPIFIGYPYGLVEADRIARISNQEKESLKTMFLVKLRNKNIEKYLSSVNAHEILDRISF
ncbi:DNA double-strand break repair nuclease NurA [Candidatus Woesearchaeota archaeon]|nr:DNA double-strand break repair nuclease NurA [Candidatus Woesearchaeota archaeon]